MTLFRTLVAIVIAVLVQRMTAVLASPNSRADMSRIRSSDDVAKLLPRLPDHPDESYILELVAEGDPSCILMKPVVKRLENELNTKILRIDISRRPEYAALFELVGGNEGVGLPLYYNRRTAQAISGPTPFSNLLRLGTSDPSCMFYLPPVPQKNEFVPASSSGVGLHGGLKDMALRVGKEKLLKLPAVFSKWQAKREPSSTSPEKAKR